MDRMIAPASPRIKTINRLARVSLLPWFAENLRQDDKRLLMGNGWLYAILDSCLGAKTLIPPVPDASDGTMCKAVLFDAGATETIVLSAFNVDRAIKTKQPIKIHLPMGHCSENPS